MGILQTIKAKLLAAFVVTSLVSVVVAYFGIQSAERVGEYLAATQEDLLPTIVTLGKLDNEIMEGLFQTRNSIMATAAKDAEKYKISKAKRADTWVAVDALMADYEKRKKTPEEARLWQDFAAKLKIFRPATDAVMAALEEGDEAKARDIGYSVGEPAAKEMLAPFNELIALQSKQGEEFAKDGAAAQTSARNIMMLVTVLAIFGALGLGFMLTLSITKPLSDIAGAAASIAEGHIDQNIDRHSADELGQLADSFRQLVDYIKGASNAAQALSQGDLSVKVEARSQQDVLSRNLAASATALNGLLHQTSTLIAAAEKGELSKRGDTAQFQGAYRELVEGFNRVMEAIVAPVSETSSVLEQAATRNLTARMKGDYRGDYAKIKQSLNTAVGNLHDGLSSVAMAVDQVASASSQIASSSQAVAQGASEQARSLAENSSSLSAMSSMTKGNATNTTMANEMAAAAKSASGQGSEAMGQMSEAMEKIRAAAEGTAAIIRDINEIAFQTNLLALNAAVEAARAGDAGRGFAVVAEEVRNLALRSKEAAKKTESLINDSVNLAKHGENVSKQVSQNLGEIVGTVTKVTEIIGTIAAASVEQSRGIDQVSQAVGEMDRVTQQNAASSEESSSAAQELSSQAQEMAVLVGQFQLDRKTKAITPATKAKGLRKLGAGSPPPKAARPAAIIPFDDDPVFKDF